MGQILLQVKDNMSKKPGNKINMIARKNMRRLKSKNKQVLIEKNPMKIVKLREEIKELESQLKESYERSCRITE